jgi:hypothetical protein
MYRRVILCALACAAMIPAAALAQRGGGPGGGGPPSGMGGFGAAGGFGPGGPGGMGNGGFGNAGFGSTMRDQARMNSQGPTHASATGIANANANSVLAGTTATKVVRSGALAGLTTGTTLFSNGTAVGTVQQIRTTGSGSVAVVVVKGTNGGLYAVPANKLAFSGGTLSTTARLSGINTSTNVAINSQARLNSQGPLHASATGIAHANAHSVLAGASTSALTGVSVGMPLFSNGAQVGTIYRVITANGVITRVLVQGSNGRIYSLAPRTLTASGGTVTTTMMLRGI